jgi:cysteine synthase B
MTAYLPEYITIYAKAEWMNPGGSVKDRPALNIVTEALRRGDLGEGITLLDSTSGNTGIAYAMFGAALGFQVKLVIPENASPERIKILKAYGVELELTDPLEGSDGAIRRVREIAQAEPDRYFYANQYENDDNWLAHYKTTGAEIWEQTGGAVTHFVAGLGTSGTLVGTSRRLKAYNPEIEVIAMQPDSPFHGLEGWKHMPTAIRPGIYDETVHDQLVDIQTEQAHEMCRRLAREEGRLVGISAGAALAGALTLAERLAERSQPATIVTLFPDDASKYLSDAFWAEG